MPLPPDAQSYLPIDRRWFGDGIPACATGAVLTADVGGFTALTRTMAEQYGAQRGMEEVTRLMDQVFDTLISAIHCYRGSVIGFAGDAITCWFAENTGERAISAALAMHTAMHHFTDLSIKVVIATGEVRRFLVGDPTIQVIDVLAGAPLERIGSAGALARRGEVVVDAATATTLSDQLHVADRRSGTDGNQYAVVDDLTPLVAPDPWPTVPHLPDDEVRPWLLPPIYERLANGQGEFLTELRPGVALFLRFAGIDYDHEDAADHLDTYIRYIQTTVQHYGGHLIQLTLGDKGSYLYAAFGAPITYADLTERALAAAWSLRQPPAGSVVQSVQIGVSRGTMLAGAYGGTYRRTYGVLGPEVNFAAHLMLHARPGQVLVSERIREDMEQSNCFAAIPNDPISIKGHAQPVQVATVSVPDGRMMIPRPHMQYIPRLPVGREAEQAALATALAALSAGQGQCVIIEGEAGIGKSRLVTDLMQQARTHHIRTLIGVGQSIRQQSAYAGWQTIISDLLDLKPSADPLVCSAQARRALQGATPAHLDHLPLLAELLDLPIPDTTATTAPFDPRQRQEALLALLLALLHHHAGRGPLLIVLEDAHWLDSLAWELAVQAARDLTDVPLLLVLTTRPLPPGTPAMTALGELHRLPATVHLPLPPLDDVAITALAARLLRVSEEAIPASLTDLLRDRTGGNPFVIEETLRALQTKHVLTVQDGTITLDTTRAILLPDTIQGLILARADRLEPEQGGLLRWCAVLGDRIQEPILQAILDRPSADLSRTLLMLEGADFLGRDVHEPAVWRWRHAITREAIYAMVSFAQRRASHHTVARAYEAHPEHHTDYALLAHHSQQAEDTQREAHYARLAGEQAAAQFANNEAITYLSRVLVLLPTEEWQNRLAALRVREQVYDLLGERAAQAADLADLATLAADLKDDDTQAQVTLRWSQYHRVTGDYDQAVAAAAQALTLTAQDEIAAQAHLAWGEALLLRDDYADARERLEQAITLAGETRISVVGRCLHLIGQSWYSQGKTTQAQDYQEKALHQYQALSDQRGMAAVLKELGTLALEQAELDRAHDFYYRALAIYQSTGDRYNEGIMWHNLGQEAQYRGDFAEAQQCYTRELHTTRAIGDRAGEGIALNALGVLELDQNHYRQATPWLEQSIRIAHDLDDPSMYILSYDALGLIAFYQGNYEQAAQMYQQVYTIARQLGDQYNIGRMFALYGLLAHHRGDHRTAHDLCQEALHLATSHRVVPEQASALLYAGHAATARSDLTIAQKYYQEALTLLEPLQPNRVQEARAGLARVAMRQGDLPAASAQVELILAHLNAHPALCGTDEPMRVWLSCIAVLRATHDERAATVLDTACRLLLERADTDVEPTLRRSFLERVPHHRALLHLAELVREGIQVCSA